MALFLTRRTYNTTLKKFTNNLASLTRPVWLRPRPGGGYEGGIISQDDWFDQVAGQANGKGVVIYVHGFNTPQSMMLKRLDLLEAGIRRHGFDGAVVGFDWPSKGIVTAYDPDRTTAQAVAPFLVPEVLMPLMARLPGQPVHIVAHSMGCYLTLRALSGAGDHPGQAPCVLNEALFVAADVEAEALRQGAWGALVMERRCARFTNYYSVADKVLRLSGGVVHGGRDRAGHVGLPELKPAHAVDIYTTAQFRAHVPVADQEDMILSHNWYYENDGFYQDTALTIAGTPDANMPTRRPTNISDRALLTGT